MKNLLYKTFLIPIIRKVFFVLVILFSSGSAAQSFYDSTFTPIPDTSQICLSLNVTGLPNAIDSTFGLDSVWINITHPFDQDLVIELYSPDGNHIKLAGGVGASGDNFINTCFAMNGDSGHIASGTPPFTGTFVPQESINLLNNGQDPNGVWKMCISDTYMSDQGDYHNCQIHFSPNPPPDPVPPPVLCNFCSCPGSADTCDLLPDLTVSELCLQKFRTEYPGYIRIANSTPNLGIGPIEVHGIDSCFCDLVPVDCDTICPQGSVFGHVVIQRIYQRYGSDTLSWYDHYAGKMELHPGHNHLHLDGWSDYSIRLQVPDPDPLKWPTVGNSTKQSFCLMNLSNCTDSIGFCKDSLGNILNTNDILNAGFGLYSGCGLDQGIYPGHLDLYDENQNDPINLANLCNGDYFIVSVVDPLNKFVESNDNNNVAQAPVTLSMQQLPSGIASFNYTVNGSQVTFTNTSPPGTIYLWNFGDGNWVTGFSTAHTYSVAGTYTVSLVAVDQCYTVTSQVIVITGVDEFQKNELNLQVYQNPVQEGSFFTYFLSEGANVEIQISDVMGKWSAGLFSGEQSYGLQEFSLADLRLRRGVYFLQLYAMGLGSSTTKIVVLE